MKNPSKFLCRLVSVLGLLCTGFCVWYVVSAASAVLGSPEQGERPPHFLGWYLALSFLALLIAAGVAVGSIGLARLRVSGARVLTICSFLPLPLQMIVGVSWLSPMGNSIAAATGVGLGGLMPMLLLLLPLWAGLLWMYAFPKGDHQASQPDGQGSTGQYV